MRTGINEALCANLALKAYEEHNWLADNIEGVAAEAHGCLYLACRGTSKNEGDYGTWSLIRDVVSDIRLFPRYNPLIGWAPGGFLDAGEAVAEQAAKFYLPIKKPLVLVGHSLGGAAALIAAEILVAEGYPVMGVVAFGAPHTGRLKRLQNLGLAKLYRYGSDIVTTVPPFWRPAVSTTTKLRRMGNGGPLEDHCMVEYFEAILRR